MATFKIGDRVKQFSTSAFYYQSKESEGTVIGFSSSDWITVKWDNGHTNSYPEFNVHLIEKTKNKIMNPLETFKNLFVKEPQKSYRAVGITDAEDNVTREGIQIVLTHLLNDPAFSEKLLKEVVEPMKEALEKSKK